MFIDFIDATRYHDDTSDSTWYRELAQYAALPLLVAIARPLVLSLAMRETFPSASEDS